MHDPGGGGGGGSSAVASNSASYAPVSPVRSITTRRTSGANDLANASSVIPRNASRPPVIGTPGAGPNPPGGQDGALGSKGTPPPDAAGSQSVRALRRLGPSLLSLLAMTSAYTG